jgi:hypothetical protein
LEDTFGVNQVFELVRSQIAQARAVGALSQIRSWVTALQIDTGLLSL